MDSFLHLFNQIPHRQYYHVFQLKAELPDEYQGRPRRPLFLPHLLRHRQISTDTHCGRRCFRWKLGRQSGGGHSDPGSDRDHSCLELHRFEAFALLVRGAG